jgi:hypothetical protein
MRVHVLRAIGLVVVAGLLGQASASPAVASRRQTVRIVQNGPKVSVRGTVRARPGWTRFAFSTAKGVHEIALFELRKGRTVAGFRRTLRKLRDKPTPLFAFGRIVIDTSPAAGHPSIVDTKTRQRTYVVVDVDRQRVAAVFTVPGGHGGRAPTWKATIKLRDFRIASTALPTSGVVRVVNSGPSAHRVDVLRLLDPTTAAAALALLRKGGEGAVSSLVDRPSSRELVGLTSPGVVLAVHYSGLRPGVYLLACDYGDVRSHGVAHTMLGMETAVAVG